MPSDHEPVRRRTAQNGPRGHDGDRPVAGRGGERAGGRPVAGRGDRTGARGSATGGRPPTDRPSYHPRATANRRAELAARETGLLDPEATRLGTPRVAGRPADPDATRLDTGRAGTRSRGRDADATRVRRRDGRAGLTGTMMMRGGAGGRGRGVSDRARRPVHPAQVDPVYDTVDQAALDRIDIRDRDEHATTYQRVDRERGTGARSATGPRRSTGPGRGTGPNGTNRAAASGRKMGTRGPKWWRARPLWLRRLVVLGGLGFFLMFVAGIAVIYSATKIPLPEEVKTDQVSIITYADGEREIARVGIQNRIDVKLADVSKAVQHAVLAAENKDFYEEPGISPRGIARALWVNIRGGEIQQGGSTITQQYVKNAYLSQERTFSRKMKEIVMAVKLDRKYSKDQILEFYLNTIYFGRGAYGIEAAAQTYFGKHAKDLNAGEGAVIAGLIRAPEILDPAVNPDRAKARWKDVIATMVAEGWLAQSEAPTEPPPVLPKGSGSLTVTSDQAEYIQRQVIKELEARGISEQQIKTGGLRIRTTIDYDRQIAAFNAVNEVMAGPTAQTPDLQTGLVAVEPGTGRVIAWYGGSLYGRDEATGREDYYDNVSDAAVPSGSTFKTVTLLAALESGISLKSTFQAPASIDISGEWGTYHVENNETHVDWGIRDLVFATAESLNTVYVPLGLQVGIDNVIDMAQRLGVTSPLKAEAGVSLGPDSATAQEIVSIYSTLAAGGVRTTPHIVEEVVAPDGEVIYTGQADPETVLDSGVVRDATYALQQVFGDQGTAKSARLADNRPAAGKTGTVEGFRAAWFCGYTTRIASCVNMFRGNATEGEALTNLPGVADGVYGGTWPAKIWKVFMDAASAGQPIEQFQGPVYGGTITKATPTATPSPTETPTPEATQSSGGWPWDSWGRQTGGPGGGQSTGPALPGLGGGGSGGGGGGQQPTQPEPGVQPTPETPRWPWERE
ncbi:MAG: transglycosylase domain-containing protein [Frankia sp.]|nr:transglycosylase domain-containing protein [Frankia sp.]